MRRRRGQRPGDGEVGGSNSVGGDGVGGRTTAAVAGGDGGLPRHRYEDLAAARPPLATAAAAFAEAQPPLGWQGCIL